jgi:hypothetical protein
MNFDPTGYYFASPRNRYESHEHGEDLAAAARRWAAARAGGLYARPRHGAAVRHLRRASADSARPAARAGGVLRCVLLLLRDWRARWTAGGIECLYVKAAGEGRSCISAPRVPATVIGVSVMICGTSLKNIGG